MRDRGFTYVVIIICGVLILALGLSFLLIRRESQPVNVGPLPDREIVFLPGTPRSDVIGFIHSDGSGYVEIQITIFESAEGLLGYLQPSGEYRPLFGGLFTWSPNGEYLVSEISSRTSNNPGHNLPILISTDGSILWCDDRSRSSVSWGNMYSEVYNRAWVVSGTQVVTVADARSLPTALVVDMQTCEFSPLLVGGEPLIGEALWEVTVSSQGEVAAWFQEGPTWITMPDGTEEPIYEDTIQVFNSEGNQVTILSNASYPTWSQDGEWLAYVGIDGMYVARRDASEQHRIVEEDCLLGPPSWSPDGQWIVYDCYYGPIFKVNLATGEAIQIFEGGGFPAWRLDDIE